jgi:hypothetical protein
MRRIGSAVVAVIAVGTIVTLSVVGGGSNEPVTVPDVVGKPYTEATRALTSAGFRVVSVNPACLGAFEGFPAESVVVSRIRRGDTGVQGGVDTAPRGEKLALDTGVVGSGSISCVATTGGNVEWRMLLGALWVSGALILSVVAGRDMRRRGERGGVWGAIVFFLFPLGLLLWLVVRADKPLRPGTDAALRRDAETFSPFPPSG